MNLFEEIDIELKDISLEEYEPRDGAAEGEEVIGILPENLRKLCALWMRYAGRSDWVRENILEKGIASWGFEKVSLDKQKTLALELYNIIYRENVLCELFWKSVRTTFLKEIISEVFHRGLTPKSLCFNIRKGWKVVFSIFPP